MNVVVIVANGWNAGWLGCYGNEWLSTPALDRLASESIVFDQHFAVNPSADEWFRSIASGRFEIGPERPGSLQITDWLKQSHVKSVRIHDVRDHPQVGADGWDVSINALRNDKSEPGVAITEAIKQQLPQFAKHDRWMLWIETDRLMPPWSVSMDHFDPYAKAFVYQENGPRTPPWDEPPLGHQLLGNADLERLQGTFASVVSELDADINTWIDLIGIDSACLLITSGYGSPLGERDWIGPGFQGLHEEVSHLPLIMRLPNAEQGGRRVLQQTATVDLFSTLAEALAATPPSGLHGRSLLPLARGASEPLRPYLCQLISTHRALRNSRWALLQSTGKTSLLFQKPEDRWEANDVRMKELEWAEYLEATMAGFVEAASRQPFTPPDLQEYEQVIEAAHSTENDDEHGEIGGREHESPEGESGLRRHQGDQED